MGVHTQEFLICHAFIENAFYMLYIIHVGWGVGYFLQYPPPYPTWYDPYYVKYPPVEGPY